MQRNIYSWHSTEAVSVADTVQSLVSHSTFCEAGISLTQPEKPVVLFGLTH